MNSHPANGDPAHVAFEAVGKTYRGADRPALRDVTLAIPRGSFFGLLGSNGAGKTTLISILCGLLDASRGAVRIDTPAGMVDPLAARAHLGLVPQELALYGSLTVEENLRFFGAMHGLSRGVLEARVTESVAMGQLEGVRRQRVETLSGGLRRRLNFAVGVVHAPRLLVLDEPTVGVDAQSRHFLQQGLRRLNERGTTIVYTSHYLEEVERMCDRLAVIDHGTVIAAGTLAELLRADLLEIRLAAAPAPSLIARLSALDGLTGIRAEGTLLALVTESPQRVLETALAILTSADARVTEVKMGARSLESLFFQLTGSRLPEIEDADEPH